MRRWPFFIIGVMHFVYMKRNPFTYKYFWLLLMGIAVATVVFFFRGRSETGNSQQADLYNTQSYSLRYKDLQASSLAALQAFKQSAGDPIRRAEALNNMAFCAFMQMDFERSAQLLRQVYGTSSSELEALVADVGMMRLCQRTSMNKDFTITGTVPSNASSASMPSVLPSLLPGISGVLTMPFLTSISCLLSTIIIFSRIAFLSMPSIPFIRTKHFKVTRHNGLITII